MFPHCCRTVLLYAPTIMRQPEGLKFSHPVPYPRWRESARQSWVCSGAGAEQGLERIPLFWAVWCLGFEDLYQSEKSSVIRRWVKAPALFQNKCKKNKQTNPDSEDPGPPFHTDGHWNWMPCLGLGASFRFRMSQEWDQTSGFSYFLPNNKEETPTPNYSFSVLRNNQKWWKW